MSIGEALLLALISMMPVIEARGAYPLAFVMGYDDIMVFILVFLASTSPSIPLIYGLSWIEEKIVRKNNVLNKFYARVIERVRVRAEKVSRYSIVYVGLALYVAIPLPGTGVWTGSLISYLLKLDKRKSLIAVILGNLVACTIIYLFIVVLKISL